MKPESYGHDRSTDFSQSDNNPPTPFVFRAMNTNVEAHYEGTADRIRQAHLLTLQWFQSVERRFSRFIPDSELNAVNESGGKPHLVSEAMMEVLVLAQSFRERTDGVFNPLLLAALERCGYGESFEAVAASRHTLGERMTAGLPDAKGWPELDKSMKAVVLPRGAKLDLGGIVKGWAVQRFALWLKSAHGVRAGWLNAGGDLTAWGMDGAEGAPLAIGVENPWNPEKNACVLTLGSGSAATSSKLGRRWETDLGPMHHLIDPDSLKPSDSDVVQCTVAGPDLVECEVWAKTICIAGVKRGLELFAQASGYEAVYFTEEGRTGFAGSEQSAASKWQGLRADDYSYKGNR